jgi:hypothetical protein
MAAARFLFHAAALHFDIHLGIVVYRAVYIKALGLFFCVVYRQFGVSHQDRAYRALDYLLGNEYKRWLGFWRC